MNRIDYVGKFFCQIFIFVDLVILVKEPIVLTTSESKQLILYLFFRSRWRNQAKPNSYFIIEKFVKFRLFENILQEHKKKPIIKVLKNLSVIFSEICIVFYVLILLM